MADKIFTAGSFADFNWTEILEYIKTNVTDKQYLDSIIKGTKTYTLGNAQIITSDYEDATGPNFQQGRTETVKTIKEEFVIEIVNAKTNSYTTNDKIYDISKSKAIQYELIEIIFKPVQI